MANMKKLSMVLLGATVVALGTSSTAQAVTLGSTSSGQFGTINEATGSFTQVGSGTTFTDIAASANENIFGITFTDLYSINPNTGSSARIGSLGGPGNINALDFSNGNVLYAAGGSGFYTIDTSTGAASLVANIPGFNSAGDIVFDPTNNRFFATSGTGGSINELYSITPTGNATSIGNIGFNGVFGLTFGQGVLRGYTNNNQEITIDPTTGAGTFVQNITGVNGEIFGATSTTPVPEPSSTVGLLAVGVLGAGSMLKRKLKKQKSVKVDNSIA